jgi:predicted MFS family arabinose efflux permease
VSVSFLQGLQWTPTPVLSQINSHFPEAGVSMVQMLVTGPSFVAMFMAIVSGWLVQKISMKTLLLAAGAVAGATGLLPLLADSFPLLFCSRLVYGAVLGLSCALSTAIVARYFTGKERTQVMGVQAASIGVSMVIINLLSGWVGQFGFRYSYFIYIIGFISLVLIACFLPAEEKSSSEAKEKIHINGTVFKVAFWGILEFFFLITFATNIAMHITENISTDSTLSGIATGLFAAAQIVIGLLLGFAVRVFKKYTIPASMLCFSAGALLLICFSTSRAALCIGAVLCGFSQGMFVPQAMTEVSNAVLPKAAAMAAAVLTCGQCIGQVISPFALNTICRLVFGSVNTNHIYLLAIIGMTVSAAGVALSIKHTSKLMDSKENKR